MGKDIKIPEKSSRYKESGVDIDEGNKFVSLIKSKIQKTNIPGVIGSMGGFGASFDLKSAGFSDPILVSATDGVGTKLKIAIDTGKTETIGIDLVAMCVNDLICEGARPLFFLDYYASGKLHAGNAAKVLDGIITGCKQAGCALVGGETAEMPDLYYGEDFDLSGFAVGAMERGNELPKNVKPGDFLIGIPSSGFHSNGYSLLRKIVNEQGLKWDSECPFAPSKSIADILLEPTRIYQSLLGPLITNGGVSALSHITGGGITENLPRILPKHCSFEIDLTTWEVPDSMKWFIDHSQMTQEEALRTFNCGIGMIGAVSGENLSAVENYLSKLNEPFLEIGQVVDAKANAYLGNLSTYK